MKGNTVKVTNASCQFIQSMTATMPTRMKIERARPVIDQVTKSCNTPTSLIRRLISRPTL